MAKIWAGGYAAGVGAETADNCSIGTSSTSWEDAANNVIKEASKHLRELRVAAVVKKDPVVRNGKVEAYRTRLKLSFKYEAHA